MGKLGIGNFFLVRSLFIVLYSVVILSLLHCPKEFPQQELSEARLQLSAAKEEGAADLAAKDYGDSEKSLLDAQRLVVDEEYGDASKEARKAILLAMSAREVSLPVQIKKSRTEAGDAIEVMTKIGSVDSYPEEYKKAKGLFTKAEKAKSTGDGVKQSIVSSSNKEEKYMLRRRALGYYRSALISYKEVKGVSDKVAELSKSQSQNVSEAIQAAKETFKKVKEYGATTLQLKGPIAELAKTEKAYKQERYSDALKLAGDLQKSLDDLLVSLAPEYARKLLVSAKSSVSKIEKYLTEKTEKKEIPSVESTSASEGEETETAKKQVPPSTESVSASKGEETTESSKKQVASSTESVSASKGEETDTSKKQVASSTESVSVSEGEETDTSKKQVVPSTESASVSEGEEKIEALKEQVASAQEAIEASEKFLDEQNYVESIQESKDAIRLAQVVIEQQNLIASSRQGSLKGGETRGVLTGDGRGLVEELADGWKRYTVRGKRPADCLWCIAARVEVYGKGHLWERIYQANKRKVNDPNLIYPKQVLYIPPPTGKIGNPPR